MAQHDEFHTERINKRKLRVACCLRVLSVLVFLKLALTLGGFAFYSLRASHPITLAPFETHEVKFCPSWFRGVDVIAPFPSNEYVTVHKFKGRPNVTEENETYRVGYNLELEGGHFGRTHSRSYFFPAGATFDLDFESSSPVNFFIVHPDQKREHRWSPRDEPHHGERHHGDRHREGHRGHHGQQNNGNSQPQPNYGHHEATTKKEFHVAATGGRYDLIFSLPRNSTTHTRVAVRINASVKTLDISHSCPMRSSLSRGQRHVRLSCQREREHVVLAASPYARTSSLVYVRLVPREHKFAVVSGILFAVYVVLRLIARYLRAHSGLQRGQGKCFWSRLCGRKNNNVEYAAVPQVQVVYPGHQ